MLGGLVGLERQFAQTDDKEALLGVRTFVFISLLGALSAFVSEKYLAWFPAVSFLALLGIVITRYIIETMKTKDIGITTEVTELLVFLIGAITYWGHLKLAIALAVGITLMLSLKTEIQRWTKKIATEDIRAIIKFAIISVVILPLLEDNPLDKWGLFNPREVWFMVVLISAVSFTGYTALKFGKIKSAFEWTGLFGGLVSSTAVSLSFSRRSLECPAYSKHLARGILLAELVMFPRLLFLSWVVSADLVFELLVPLISMFTVGLIVVLLNLWRGEKGNKDKETIDFRNPFEISTALTFGAIYAMIRIIAALALQYFGQKGLYTTAVLSGIAETDAITLTIARMVEGSGDILSPKLGAKAVTLAVLTNTIFKGTLVLFVATPNTKRSVLLSFSFILIVGFLSLLFI